MSKLKENSELTNGGGSQVVETQSVVVYYNNQNLTLKHNALNLPEFSVM